MPHKIKISFAESAIHDLEELKIWYLEQGAPDAGLRIVTEILQKIEDLPLHPDIGRIVPEFRQPFLRELIHPPFRIVYRRDPSRIRVVRV
jgi:plasmid stabilization system protein ParE